MTFKNSPWPAQPAPKVWRQVALVALWSHAAALFGMCLYIVSSTPNLSQSLAGVEAFRSFLAALISVWWVQVFSKYTLKQAVPSTDGVWRALTLGFPWLTSLRLALWFMSVLFFGAVSTQANSVAVTALMTITLGFSLAKNAVYGTLSRFAHEPENEVGQQKLMQWLNVSGALSLGLGVVNVVPIMGLGSSPTLTDIVMTSLVAVLDVLACVLALKAVQYMHGPIKPPLNNA